MDKASVEQTCPPRNRRKVKSLYEVTSVLAGDAYGTEYIVQSSGSSKRKKLELLTSCPIHNRMVTDVNGYVEGRVRENDNGEMIGWDDVTSQRES